MSKMVWGNDDKMATDIQKIRPAINKQYSELIKPLLQNARVDISVCMYQWRWYSFRATCPMQRLNYEYLSASRRGVHVRVVLNLDHVGGNLSKAHAQTARELKRAGVDVKTDGSGQLVHAKFVIIDQEIVILGSHNYSEKSMASNIETSVIIKDREIAQIYQKLFNELFKRN